MLVVKTKEELKRAREEKVSEFIIEGELANKLYKTRNISKLNKRAVIALSLAIGAGALATPITGGLSLPVTGALVGKAVATIGGTQVVFLAVSLGGVAIIYSIYKDYNVEFIFDAERKVKVKLVKK